MAAATSILTHGLMTEDDSPMLLDGLHRRHIVEQLGGTEA
jgi:hypothetical protein